ncbi:MAG: EAL domain-containing protein [Caulobacteraceae bacterium]|nr:EAL domain-containing protein [Caulobacter sp.]
MTYAPLAAVAALACAVFVGSLAVGARQIDGAERRREESLIARDTPRRVADVGATVNPFVMWDEALQKLDGVPDKAWASDNIASLCRNPAIERLMVLDHDGRPSYAAQGRGAPSPAMVAALAAAAAPAVADVRRIESSGRMPPNNVAVRSARITLVQGRPALVTASLLRSDTGKVKPLFGHAPVLVVQHSLELALRKPFAERFLLPDMATSIVRGPPPPGRAEVDLAELGDGRRLVLRWAPEKPAELLLQRSAPSLIFAGLLVLAAGAAVALHARRVTRKLVKSQAEARRLALQDPLTGLANRLLFHDRLSQARERLRRTQHGVVGLLCLDLDRFKEVNDTWGHEAGDELIQEVGRRLQAVCRGEDTVARLGGDEFAVVARADDAAGVATLAQRVVGALSGAVQLSAAQVGLSCSIGVTVLGDGEVDQAEALRQADLALYRSKERGRGRYTFFEPEMDAALRTRKQLESDLREAVDADAVELAYQPLVDASGRITAVEALARWNHPERGLTPPGVFIPVAEESGLISQLAAQLFRRACLDARDWGEVRLAFNISPIQLRRPGMIERLEGLLEATGAEPSLIDMELTEGTLLQDDAKTHEVLGAMRRMGFRLVLDDFGTGYSSLSYLHRYPVQKIKLDRAFIARLGVTAEARAIVAALIRMAEALNLRVVAEGVETVTQFDMLCELGCAEFQGFLFSRPTDIATVGAMIREGRSLLPARGRALA